MKDLRENYTVDKEPVNKDIVGSIRLSIRQIINNVLRALFYIFIALFIFKTQATVAIVTKKISIIYDTFMLHNTVTEDFFWKTMYFLLFCAVIRLLYKIPVKFKK